MTRAESDVVGWATAGKDTGTWGSQVYHTRRDCSQLASAHEENLAAVTADDRDRYHMRECSTCQNERTAELLGASA